MADLADMVAELIVALGYPKMDPALSSSMIVTQNAPANQRWAPTSGECARIDKPKAVGRFHCRARRRSPPE
jgi:hypothetical protein